MSQLTASVLFSIEELWLLQAAIRHEMAQQEQWKAPPVSAALNDQVAEALVRCEETGLAEAAILLTRLDCLAIDFNVSQSAKSAAGVPIGKAVLMKSYRARREIDEGTRPSVPEPEQLDADALATQLQRWKSRRDRRKRSV